MSRCILDDEENEIEVVIGWDPLRCSFFAQVTDPARYQEARAKGADDYEAEQATRILWTGGIDVIYRTPQELDVLIEAITPFAQPFDAAVLRRELLRDQAEDNGRRTYTVMEDGTV